MIKFNELVHIEPKIILKSEQKEPQPELPESGAIKARFKIQKADDDKMLAFGWAYVCVKENGEQVVDYSGDIVEASEIEQAAYKFVKFWRDGSDNHERGGVAVLVESVVLTKEKQKTLGIAEGTLPEGWWVGFEITDPDVWDKVKSGEYSMMSIEGEAVREEIPEEGATE
ncbi:MAG: XkdF-like putative serine protease domain-containing protein [Oscillospiraceae bacterium]|nr:XkdF-like putative serine protease domain-containing protein [Oscillospiraceae bacterium]